MVHRMDQIFTYSFQLVNIGTVPAIQISEKEGLMAWQDGLAGIALEIAKSTDSPIRVMAGPGTGKSYAMKRRLMRLLAEGASPKRILVVTFTRTAAADLVKDIEGLGVEGCSAIWAGTLHSYCFSVLTKRYVLAVTHRVPRPLVTFP